MYLRRAVIDSRYLLCRQGSETSGDEIFFYKYVFISRGPLPAAVSTTALSVTERNEGASSGVERSIRNVLWETKLLAVGPTGSWRAGSAGRLRQVGTDILKSNMYFFRGGALPAA